MKPFKIKRGRFKGYKVEMANTKAIKLQQQNVDKLLLLIGKYMGWDGDISHVFVSDESRLGDFPLEVEEIVDLSTELGFLVDNKDLIYEIALRMKPAN